MTIDPNGKNGVYFDRAYSRWVPVPRSSVSPDGAHYAYVEMGQSDEFRELASATCISPQPGIFDYSTEGIYLVQGFEYIWPGVFLFDPGTSSIRKAADVETAEVIAGGGVLWFGQVNSTDPSPFSTRSAAGIFSNEVDRLDLKTSLRAQWLYRPGEGLEVLGVDSSSRPLIRVVAPGNGGISSSDFFNHSDSVLLLGLDSTSQRSIYKGQLVESLGDPVADSHGVWFGSDQGIYLYSQSGGLQKVSDHHGYPANGCF